MKRKKGNFQGQQQQNPSISISFLNTTNHFIDNAKDDRIIQTESSISNLFDLPQNQFKKLKTIKKRKKQSFQNFSPSAQHTPVSKQNQKRFKTEANICEPHIPVSIFEIMQQKNQKTKSEFKKRKNQFRQFEDPKDLNLKTPKKGQKKRSYINTQLFKIVRSQSKTHKKKQRKFVKKYFLIFSPKIFQRIQKLKKVSTIFLTRTTYISQNNIVLILRISLLEQVVQVPLIFKISKKLKI